MRTWIKVNGKAIGWISDGKVVTAKSMYRPKRKVFRSIREAVDWIREQKSK